MSTNQLSNISSTPFSSVPSVKAQEKRKYENLSGVSSAQVQLEESRVKKTAQEPLSRQENDSKGPPIIGEKVAVEIKPLISSNRVTAWTHYTTLTLPEESEEESSSESSELELWTSDPRFQELETIGEGTSSLVVKAFDTASKCWVAVKKVIKEIEDKDEDDLLDIADFESSILRQITENHTPHRLNWIAEYGASIVTDFIPEKNIHQMYLSGKASQGELDFDDVVTNFRQVLEFLCVLRKQRIIHADLKPSNMVYEKALRYLTILDYGLAFIESEEDPGLIQTRSYRCPEVILQGTSEGSQDLWSLACIIYELLTKRPLFNFKGPELEDKEVSRDREHLRMIALQIGLPSRKFLESCKEASKYYQIEPEVAFLDKSVHAMPPRWDLCLYDAGKRKQVPIEQMHQLVSLLQQMLKYDNRATPETLLQSPLFQQDICFHLAADLPSEGKILIHRISDVFTGALNDPMKPVLTIVLGSPVTRTCYHLPKDPSNHYVIFVHLPGPCFIPVIHVTLKDGDTLDLKQHINQP